MKHHSVSEHNLPQHVQFYRKTDILSPNHLKPLTRICRQINHHLLPAIAMHIALGPHNHGGQFRRNLDIALAAGKGLLGIVGMSQNTFGQDIAVDWSGNIYVTGRSIGSGTAFDYATIKYSSGGTELWVRRYDGSASIGDVAKAMAVDSSGNVYVTGISNFGPNQDFMTIKYDTDGGELWAVNYDGPNNYDDPNDLAIDSSGNVYVTGESAGIGTNTDYATVRYNTNGTQVWVSRYNGDANGFDIPRAITVDLLGNVYVTGGSDGSGTNVDYATIKYSQTTNPVTLIKNLIAEVENLVASGILNQGQGNALIVKLEGALKKLEKGNIKAACNQLGAFVNQVNAFVNSGKLTPEQGQALIDAANAVIDQLCG